MEHVGHLAPRTGTMEARPHCGGKPTSLTELCEVAKNPGNSGFRVITTDGTVPSGMAQKLSDLPCKRERKAGAVQVDVVADCTHHGCNLITSVTCLRCWWCVGQSCCVGHVVARNRVAAFMFCAWRWSSSSMELRRKCVFVIVTF